MIWKNFIKDKICHVIKMLIQKTVAVPIISKEMNAQYIWYSDKYNTNGEPQLVWIIDLRGIPEILPPSSDGPTGIRQVNHIRYVINAETGEILSVANWPSPEFK